MWPPLAAVTRSNRDRKVFQTFMAKPFLVDRHTRSTYRSLELVCVAVACLASLFLNVRLQAEIEGIQICWLWRAKRPVAMVKPNRRLPLPVQCYDDKHYAWSWMLVCWHCAVFRDITPKRYVSITLFVEDRINGESFLIGKMRIWFPWFFWSFNKRMFSPDASEPLMHSIGVSLNASKRGSTRWQSFCWRSAASKSQFYWPRNKVNI